MIKQVFFSLAVFSACSFFFLKSDFSFAKPSLEALSADLKKINSKINTNNYKSVLSRAVCPRLVRLKNIEQKRFVSFKQRFEFLKEVILFYDKALDIKSNDPFLLSCIYNYYESSSQKELVKLTQIFLSPDKQKLFFKLLKSFEKGEREGNGDNLKYMEAYLPYLLRQNQALLSSQTQQRDWIGSFSYIQSAGEPQIEDFYEGYSSAVYDSKFINYFIDTLFENVTCQCEGNNGCTRGCKPGSFRFLGPVRRCLGRKPVSQTKARCARHVNSAMLNTIETFFSAYCEKSAPYIKGYYQCVKDFNKDISKQNVNICQHAFVFPSALCMLNLSGDSFSAYRMIADKEVKTSCQNWDLYNRHLYSLPIPGLGGEIPLFVKMPEEKYKEFRKAPSKIPVGAVIVSQSQSRHGHVEVRTNKMLCGKDKTEICFCSDYCEERKNYIWPYKMQAVYQWNPRLLEYIDQTAEAVD